MASQAYIDRVKEIRDRMNNMSFRDLVDHIANLEGTVEQLRLQVEQFKRGKE
jgi:hypothetical protein